jgi:hypothetical protein
MHYLRRVVVVVVVRLRRFVVRFFLGFLALDFGLGRLLVRLPPIVGLSHWPLLSTSPLLVSI